LVATVVALLVATVLVGSQLVADHGPPAPRGTVPSPTSTTASDDDDICSQSEAQACGNEHSRAVHAWVKCKAVKGRDACTKPVPPGHAMRQAKHAGTAPGPASSDGQGHAWGRAHAPGQLKDKTGDKAEDPDDDE
jgi:hypothetical protein